MSEIMRPLPFARLMKCLEEYRLNKTIFGVREIYRGGEKSKGLETPIGLAAGPHTQLAQNIVSGYAAGARIFEVKTVQTLDGDGLRRCIPRPCILSRDEGYNVEWSTELTVDTALDEYVKAYFAICILGRELSLGAPDGFTFNMSVGYDLKGITSPKIDAYIEGMKNASNTPAWSECHKWAKENDIDASFIKPEITDCITLSTLHGCPKDEIERIARYLIEQKRLNTFVKCNPTLLYAQFVRDTLNSMGYINVQFDENHFRDDLNYKDAVPMIKRLSECARERNLIFGVKLSNTMPVKILNRELAGSEMYMSGKSLYPLTISLAAKLARDFDGNINISYCGGADYTNCESIYACGISPITMATTLLKPGGYNRLKPIADKLSKAPLNKLDYRAIEALAKSAIGNEAYFRPIKPVNPQKTGGKPPIFNCFTAPCKNACPISQDIPMYMELVKNGQYVRALEIILDRNPLPNITGTICTHRCQSSCARTFFDSSVEIRNAKLKAARLGFDGLIENLKPKAKLNVSIAVIGGGPGGMAAAFIAAVNGAKVTLFEKESSLGGVVRHVIPDFRISPSAIDADEKLLRKLAVDIRLNAEINDVPSGYDAVIVAIGAQKHRETPYESVNAIDYLKSCKKGEAQKLRSAVIVGGGNTAMDAARAAKRYCDEVTIVYRRTVAEMPAEYEELKLCADEGIRFAPLRAPIDYKDGVLTLNVTRLGDVGADGRRSCVTTDQTDSLPADIVISAIGESVDKEALKRFSGCYVIGDSKRGPATVVEAISDANEAVSKIIPVTHLNPEINEPDLTRRTQGGSDCLNCPGLCSNCVDVCPNRANVFITVDGKRQVVHIDAMCNECGACVPFCPYNGAPHRDKFTRFSTMDDFENSYLSDGFLPLLQDRYLMRLKGRVFNAAYAELDGDVRRFIDAAMAVI